MLNASGASQDVKEVPFLKELINFCKARCAMFREKQLLILGNGFDLDNVRDFPYPVGGFLSPHVPRMVQGA